ncbi:MAG: acyltransferase [Planctomycetota bacterium]|jgi:acetyltransferase-like isoleucine patch superfamily enzyme
MSLKESLIRYAKKLRQWYYTLPVKLCVQSCGIGLKVNGPTCLNRQVCLGNNVNLNGLRIEGRGKVRIGNNFHSGTECLFITQNHNYDQGSAIPYDSTYIFKGITIEDNVWIGSRVIIQAGSCVVSDIPKYAIAGGHPAKVFKQRNVEHYEKLKQAGKFH